MVLLTAVNERVYRLDCDVGGRMRREKTRLGLGESVINRKPIRGSPESEENWAISRVRLTRLGVGSILG